MCQLCATSNAPQGVREMATRFSGWRERSHVNPKSTNRKRKQEEEKTKGEKAHKILCTPRVPHTRKRRDGGLQASESGPSIATTNSVIDGAITLTVWPLTSLRCGSVTRLVAPPPVQLMTTSPSS